MKYLCDQFPSLLQPGLDIRKIMKNEIFETKIKENEKQVWEALELVVTSFLRNKNDPDYKHIMEDMLEKFHVLRYKMSLKVHFLHSQLDYIPENISAARTRMRDFTKI